MTSRESRNPPKAARRAVVTLARTPDRTVFDIGLNQQRWIELPIGHQIVPGMRLDIRSDHIPAERFTLRVVTHVGSFLGRPVASLRPLTEIEKADLG